MNKVILKQNSEHELSFCRSKKHLLLSMSSEKLHVQTDKIHWETLTFSPLLRLSLCITMKAIGGRCYVTKGVLRNCVLRA